MSGVGQAALTPYSSDNPRRSQAALGLSRLGFGMAFTGDFFLAIALVLYLTDVTTRPRPEFGAVAFALVVAAAIVSQWIAWTRPARIRPLRGWFLAAWGAAVALSVAGTVGERSLPFAAAAVGTVLLTAVVVLTTREVIIATALLAAALLVGLATQVRDDPLGIGPGLVLVLFAVALPLMGTTVVRSFRALVKLELDRAHSISAIDAPESVVGMLAGEELAKLDLDAETLLTSVAAGEVPLPLPRDLAAHAATLATELRLHLIEGRRETWLYHAIAESAVLGPAVSLSDPLGLAGLLSPRRRDRLLSTLWLLLSDSPRTEEVLRLSLGERDAEGGTGLVTVVTMEAAIPRSRVDPATWRSFARIGDHRVTALPGGFRVDIDCVAERSVDR